MRTSLLEWAAMSVAVLCIVALTGVPGATLWKQACIRCLPLPLLASNLRNHARRSGTDGWRVFLALLVSMAASFLAAGFAGRILGTPLLPGTAFASVALAAAAVAWRWRRLVAAPHAFPVGRFA